MCEQKRFWKVWRYNISYRRLNRRVLAMQRQAGAAFKCNLFKLIKHKKGGLLPLPLACVQNPTGVKLLGHKTDLSIRPTLHSPRGSFPMGGINLRDGSW